MSATNGMPYLHVINRPDQKGAACHFRQRDIEFFNYSGAKSTPNFAQYNVGSAEDVCDPSIRMSVSTTFDTIGDEDIDVLIYPNPATDILQVMVPLPHQIADISILNLQGDPMQRVEDVLHNFVTLRVSDYPPGMYVVQLTTRQGKIYHEPFVVSN
jgi:hypothetical protein